MTAPADLRSQWARFQANWPLHEQTLGQHTWHYYAGGLGDETILLLGNTGILHLFPYIDVLAQHYRIIAPEWPASVRQMDALADGLHSLLQACGVAVAHVIGLSSGAMAAQVFLRRYPDATRHVVLGLATLPNERDGERVSMQRNFMRLYPSALLAWLNQRTWRSMLSHSLPDLPTSERDFWREHFVAWYARPGVRRQLLARATLMVDFHRQHRFNSRDVLSFRHQMLIIESAADEVVEEGLRGSLKALYPRAYVQTLDSDPHLVLWLGGNRLAQSIARWLQQMAQTNPNGGENR